MTQSAPPRRCGAIVGAGIVLATLTLGCPSEQESAVRKSKAVFEDTMQSEPHYAAYALEVAAASSAPYARGVIISLLGSDDYATAREAVNAIVESPPEEATEALRGVFSNKTGLLKLNAAIALARLEDEEALQYVRDEVLQAGGSLTLPAVTMLVEKGEGEALEPILAKRVTSDEPTVRDEAYVLLGEIRQPWATALLVEGLKGEFGEGRQQAIISLGRTGDPAAAEEILPFVNTKGLVFDSLQSLGALGNPEAVPSLEAMMAHENALVQLYAAAALWRVGEESTAVAHIEPMVTDPDPTLRLNLAELLANVESPRAGEMLAQLTADEDHGIRLAAFQSLAQRGSPDQIDLFVDAVADSDYTLAAVALDTLARIGTEAEVTKIAPQLENDNKYVAVSAANAILSITGT